MFESPSLDVPCLERDVADSLAYDVTDSSVLGVSWGPPGSGGGSACALAVCRSDNTVRVLVRGRDGLSWHQERLLSENIAAHFTNRQWRVGVPLPGPPGMSGATACALIQSTRRFAARELSNEYRRSSSSAPRGRPRPAWRPPRPPPRCGGGGHAQRPGGARGLAQRHGDVRVLRIRIGQIRRRRRPARRVAAAARVPNQAAQDTQAGHPAPVAGVRQPHPPRAA